MKKVILSFVILAVLGIGCTSDPTDTSRTSEFQQKIASRSGVGSEIGSAFRVEMFDSLLEKQGSSFITAQVILFEPLAIEEIAGILNQEKGPTIVSFTANIDDEKTLEQNELFIGATPFSGSLSYDTARKAIADFWGENTITHLDENLTKGNQLKIAGFEIKGSAEEIRNWWQENFDQIAEVKIILADVE